MTAVPPPAPAPPAIVAVRPPRAPLPPAAVVTPPPTPFAPAVLPSPPPSPAVAAPKAPRPPQPAVPFPPPTPMPPAVAEFWLPPPAAPPDTMLKLQALTGLLDTHSDQVIPLLREIALDPNSPDDARQAVFVLGQSRRPEAQRTVVEIARQAVEPVRIAAVRELGRFDSPAVSTELMQVYSLGGTPRLKRQIVASLGERADTVSLLRIARSEREATVRDDAILALGRTGARDALRTLYVQAPQESRIAVVTALGSARDDDELIRIATTASSPMLRLRARQQLRLLATAKAIKFLQDNP
jgi:HEAT repeat protein